MLRTAKPCGLQHRTAILDSSLFSPIPTDIDISRSCLNLFCIAETSCHTFLRAVRGIFCCSVRRGELRMLSLFCVPKSNQHSSIEANSIRNFGW